MNYLTTLEADLIYNKLISAKNIVLTGHLNPDGDCIGANLAVYIFLKNLNLNVNFFLPNDFPEFLNWLPCSNVIKIFEPDNKLHKQIFENAEIIFLIDYNDIKRVGNMGEHIEKSKAYKIMLDHHPLPQPICDFSISDINASSASEITFHFLKQLNNQYIDKDIAETIFTGILMDTGIFNFNSSNPETYITVAELLKIGADKQKIIHNIYNTSSENRLRLLGFILNKMQIFHKKRTAMFSLSKSELAQFEYKPGDTEGFVNIPLTVKDINFSIFFMESDNHIKVSLRSHGDFDVNDFARKHYKGGGHKNAAGGKSFKSLNTTISEFENILNNLDI